MLKNWFLATRPKTLVACLIPILCGTFLALHLFPASDFKWYLSVFAFLSTLCIQIGTNLVNDAIDFKKGADTSERLGPTRVSQSGLIPPKTVLKAAFLFFACAVLLGIPLVMARGLPIVILGILSIVNGYCYTGGPYPLAYKGLGDVSVFLYFGFAAVCGTYFLHTGYISLDSVILGSQVGALVTVILAVNNFRDIDTDKKANKLTLAARYGKSFARYEILFLYLFAYLLNLYWLYQYSVWLFLMGLITAPIAIKVTEFIFKNEASKATNKYLGMAALTVLTFGVFISVGFLFFL